MRVLIAFLVNAFFNLIIGLLVAKFLGRAEYGRFALTLAIGLATQVALLDWLRLSAIRFYSARARDEEPDVRATLDLGFAIGAIALCVMGCVFLFAAPRLPLSHALIGLAFAACVANGLFDYSTALVRAAFNDKLYARIVIVKNILSLTLTTGAAFYFESAEMALLGAVISILGSLVMARGALSDADARPRRANRARARTFLVYAAPIVASNLLYFLIPLNTRALAAHYAGFAVTGDFSLAYDLGLRALQTVGSALDVLLFQIAVATHEADGLEKARAQIGRNMTIVLAVMAPACVGIYFTTPSIEALIVPYEFRGPFGHYLALMLPGLLALILILFAINPIFQIEKKTSPTITAALIGAIAVPLFVFAQGRPTPDALAIAQSLGYVAALVALVLFARQHRPQWPGFRDIAGIGVGLGAMIGVLWSLRSLEPGVVTLLTQIILGAGAFGALVLIFNVADVRSMAAQWRARRAQAKAAPAI